MTTNIRWWTEFLAIFPCFYNSVLERNSGQTRSGFRVRTHVWTDKTDGSIKCQNIWRQIPFIFFSRYFEGRSQPIYPNDDNKLQATAGCCDSVEKYFSWWWLWQYSPDDKLDVVKYFEDFAAKLELRKLQSVNLLPLYHHKEAWLPGSIKILQQKSVLYRDDDRK